VAVGEALAIRQLPMEKERRRRNGDGPSEETKKKVNRKRR
jgi:hypothetical protein